MTRRYSFSFQCGFNKLLLINPALKLGFKEIINGIVRFGCEKATILVNTKDPSFYEINNLTIETPNKLKIIKVENADHNFSGDNFSEFMPAANKYLFYDGLVKLKFDIFDIYRYTQMRCYTTPHWHQTI